MFDDVAANVRDMPRALTWQASFAGLLVIIVGAAASLVIVLQAARDANLTQDQLSSWVLAITVGSGVCSIIMSLWFRQPVIAAWSTPGVALLVDSLARYPFAEAVGAYLIAGLLIMLIGMSGLFSWIMARIPLPIVMGMLAGVLVRFGIGLFNVLPDDPALVFAMFAAFFLLRRVKFRAPTVGALAVGIVVAAVGRELNLEGVSLALARPVWTAPVFTLGAFFGLAIPLCALALTAQNAPGQAVLFNAGYVLPMNGALLVTGLASVLTAPLGGHGLTLAAITAALVTGPEAHPDPSKRYAAGVATGLWYLVLGLFGTTAITLFTALPNSLVAATAGLGLIGAISSSLASAMEDGGARDGALVAFMCTAAHFRFAGIESPFWALVFGLATHALLTWRRA